MGIVTIGRTSTIGETNAAINELIQKHFAPGSSVRRGKIEFDPREVPVATLELFPVDVFKSKQKKTLDSTQGDVKQSQQS